MSKQERKSAAKTISESARQIWLAGLGAFSKAQAEGSRVFEQLIQEGSELDEKTRQYTKAQLKQMRETMEKSTERLLATGRSTMERIHGLIDRRVHDAVERLAVPTHEELRRLADQLEVLSARLDPAPMSDQETAKGAGRPKRSGTPGARKAAKATVRKETSASKKTARSAPAKATKTATRKTAKKASKAAAKSRSRRPGGNSPGRT